MKTEQAELLRKKYLYRQLLLKRKIKLPHRDAARLIGPDCAYHLYADYHSKEAEK